MKVHDLERRGKTLKYSTRIGHVPKATKVETPVIMMERSREPPSKCVHMLEAPPPGQLPLRNSPSWPSGLPGNAALARPKAICKEYKITVNTD